MTKAPLYFIKFARDRRNEMKFINSIISLIFVVITVSCGTTRSSLTYFEDIKETQEGVMTNVIPQLRIVPDDALLITVNSAEPEATAIYNMPLVNPSERGNRTLYNVPQQQTYIVSSKGDINFPVLGKIHVEGMTTEELAAYIAGRIEKDVIDPFVRVELQNFRVQVIGEVMKPGPVKVEGERLTVLDALSAAGDLTPYGERNNVLLVRQEEGINKYYHLNLNDSKTLSSPLFYLKQNDVIIVEPNDIRKANSKYNQDNAYKLSVISTIVSAVSVVASLTIALAVK